MMPTDTIFDKKMDNLQGQLDTMRHEDEVFRAHANKHFGFVATEVATKEDLRNLRMATKDDLRELELRMATKSDLGKLTEIVVKIAEKVGVSP